MPDVRPAARPRPRDNVQLAVRSDRQQGHGRPAAKRRVVRLERAGRPMFGVTVDAYLRWSAGPRGGDDGKGALEVLRISVRRDVDPAAERRVKGHESVAGIRFSGEGHSKDLYMRPTPRPGARHDG